jgi:hypothetical protein
MVITDKLRRPSALAAAALLVVASLVPLLSAKKANAYGLVTERNIKISSSNAAATDVTYLAAWKAATTTTVGGVVIDFCSTSPIIGDTCTAPAGFDVNEAGLAFTQSGLAGFTLHANTDTNTLIFTNGTPQALTSGTAYSLTLGGAGASDGITNPTGGTPGVAPENNITFYARILTYDTQANAAAYSSVAAGGGTGVVDAGGIALSTANQLTITAKVQERLTFCVYTSGVSCATGVGNSITLGDGNGVLDSNVEYTNNTAKFGVSTNANGNVAACEDVDATVCSVIIRIKGGTLKSTPGCADGSGQTCSINPVGVAAATTAAGTEYFGLRVSSSGAPLVGTAPYDGGTGTQYAFDDNNTTGTQSIYGDSISTFNAGTEQTGTLTFVGDIGATTEPGIYTTTLTFIATGTY